MFKLATRQLARKVDVRSSGRFYTTIKQSPKSLNLSRLVIGASVGVAGLYLIQNQPSIANEIDNEKLEEARKTVYEQVQKDSVSKLLPQKPIVEDANVDGVLEKLDELKEEADKETENSEDASQQGAYNPETGEINWDCPCLGGMASGPCGEEFKEAFACFVHSEEEPKGIDCIKKFENMRSCFREHPEHYKDELYEDEEPATPSNDTVEKNDKTPAEPEKTQAAVDEVQQESATKVETPQNTVDENETKEE